MGGIKRTALDALFSKYIRAKAGWICERCGKKYLHNSKGLHAAHIFTRSRQSTRFDPANVVSWDYGCHSYMDRNPYEKYEWYINKFGQDQFDSLRLRSNTPAKIDREAIKLWLKEELKSLDNVSTVE